MMVKNDAVKSRVRSDINLNFSRFERKKKTLTVCAVIIDIELIVSSDLYIFRARFKNEN